MNLPTAYIIAPIAPAIGWWEGDTLVDDPTAWTVPWSGEYVWAGSESKVYEDACH